MIREGSTSGELAQSRKTVMRTHLTALKSPQILQQADTCSKIGRRFDLKLKGGQDPDVFPLARSRSRHILIHAICFPPSNLLLHRLQTGVQFLQSEFETRLHRSEGVSGAGCDFAMTHSLKKRKFQCLALKLRQRGHLLPQITT